ncbi:alkylation response protein AidB-like acyl-CoA dehydrogenase [Actinoplanes campanulatus]|uniref:Alkylation response protein AidB-like acyl-CoA dehydrogenase n=1 Tax=Actinoplanes campanulatus TaxID=113559 RepID=A0A7W5AE48_9ACTN|nr:acyl-CoA dehydrogenase family protein [Actinoplanes campanulatus]MBB3094648.1 alkylation response protein AidB-like acyl-CoA dehydrogenase [Actinoplanes campanulatus]GGN06555.1 acyl-CoA dehydrogenase [Actinoplanes campanulatus]GID35944.1 acyl-CoA dehydrogenase [Actinoplanes campanulatus]
MTVDRMLPTPEAHDLLDLTAELATRELAGKVDDFEARGEFPRDVLRTLGRSGLLGLPYPEADGGAGQPYEVYLQVLEILAGTWLGIAEAVSVHTLSCFPVAAFGTPDQRKMLPDMLGGELLGAYALSEPQGGSDAAALATRAVADGDDYVVTGTKAWITHGGRADFYNIFCRTGGPGARGISCLLADATTPGLLPQATERLMGLRSSAPAQIVLEGARVPRDRLVGAENEGFAIAMKALDAGRLGIAACAVGLAQAAVDYATGYAKEREQFGKAIASFQGLGFMLADMATQVSAARALLLSAARLKDAGRPFSIEAAKAKLFATDMAMRVTTDAVQILGGYGYSAEHPVERWFREAKVLQIVEGTNQIQRMVIARSMTGG